MDTIFLFVMELLTGMAAVLGTSYATANILVYFLILPLVFSWLLDMLFQTSVCRIALTLVWLAVLAAFRDFNAVSDAVFSASVSFLEASSAIGLGYRTASVVVCVVLPGAALLVLTIVALQQRKFRE